MIGAAFGRHQGFSLAGVCTADDRDVFAKWREGFQGIGEIEIGAAPGGTPIMADGACIGATGCAVDHFDARQAGRVCAAVLRRGVCAGTIESKSGSASVTPNPRSTVRREMYFCVTNIWVGLLTLARSLFWGVFTQRL